MEIKQVLKKIRGVDNVEVEYADIMEAARQSNMVKHPYGIQSFLFLQCLPKLEKCLQVKLWQYGYFQQDLISCAESLIGTELDLFSLQPTFARESTDPS